LLIGNIIYISEMAEARNL